MAPVKDVFIKKLKDLNCEAVLTTALVQATSETKYTPSSSMTYSPYAYGTYAGYGGFAPYGAYGGFGGYYGYAVSTMTTPGYYTTTSKYFVEAKVFDLNTDETLLSMQTKVENPRPLKKQARLIQIYLWKRSKNFERNNQLQPYSYQKFPAVDAGMPDLLLSSLRQTGMHDTSSSTSFRKSRLLPGRR
jgi:hypothetical protein